MLLFATAAHPDNIPNRAPDGEKWYGAAPYLTGFPWPVSAIDRFAHHFFIVQTPHEPWRYARYARCIDVEYLAVTPDEVARFCHERNRLHGDATVYASVASMPAIKAHDSGMDFRWFAAEWDNDPHKRPSFMGHEAWAKQYDNPTGYEPCVLYASKF